jgi:hypothetical protein
MPLPFPSCKRDVRPQTLRSLRWKGIYSVPYRMDWLAVLVERHKKHIVVHAAVLRLSILRVWIQRRLVVKPVAVFIEEMRIIAIVQTDGVHAKFWQSVQFIGLGHTVVVLVDPQTEM